MIRRILRVLLAAAMPIAGAAAAEAPLYCDMRPYTPLQVTWGQAPGLSQVTGVFPHPLLPDRVIAATRAGLELSDDAGLTWKALPEAAAEKVGVIRKIAYHPTDTDTFYLASLSKGIWVTNDNGATFRQVGSKANGMAADEAQDMIVYPVDPFHQTLLVVHGSAAEGISRSRDGGMTWDVITTGFYFRGLLAREQDSKQLFLYGATRQEPDIQNLYVCATPGEYAMEVMHDALITDMAFSLDRTNTLYVATSDSGLYKVDGTQSTPGATQLGSKDDNWASVVTTWGPDADVGVLCLYNPTSLGLVFSTNDLATTTTYPGLPAGTLVKEGAAVRPNANGTLFYAAINEGLLIGRPDERTPVVNVTPAAFQPVKDPREKFDELVTDLRDFLKPAPSTAKAARDLCQRAGDLSAPYRQNQLTITARLPLKPAPPVSVTADLSRFGGSPATPMLDDGQHGDGAAKDGVYGYSFFYGPLFYNSHGDDWRPTWPGRMAIGITATYADGSRSGAVGVVGLYPKIQSEVLWGYYHDRMDVTTEGDVTTDSVPNPPAFHKGPTFALRIHAGRKPWSVSIPTPPWNGGDITGYQALSFGLRLADGPAPKDVYVQLQDLPDLSEATTTDRVGVTHDFVREGGISTDYHTVIVPFAKLLGKQIAQFQTAKLGKIIISGDGGDPVTLLLDWPSYLAPDQAATK